MEAKRKRTAIVDRRFSLDGAGRKMFERENAMRGRVTTLKANTGDIVNLDVAGDAYDDVLRAPDDEGEVTVHDAILDAARSEVAADKARKGREEIAAKSAMPRAAWRIDVLHESYTTVESRANPRARRGLRSGIVDIISAAADADKAREGIRAYLSAAGVAR